MISTKDKDIAAFHSYFGKTFSKVMNTKRFHKDYGLRNCLTYSGFEIYYWWFCYTALVLTNLFVVSVCFETIALKDAQKILSSYNLSVGFALNSTVPPVHEHHNLLNCFWRNNA